MCFSDATKISDLHAQKLFPVSENFRELFPVSENFRENWLTFSVFRFAVLPFR
jgi:hypothetical protein